MALNLLYFAQVVFEGAMVIGTFLMAIMTGLMALETMKDRRLRLIEKRLDEFYMPLIELFSTPALKDQRYVERVNRIVIGKRYLSGPRTARVLPSTFSPKFQVGGQEYKLGEEAGTWRRVADVIWEEAKSYIEQYYRLGGIRDYSLPREKPKWLFSESTGFKGA